MNTFYFSLDQTETQLKSYAAQVQKDGFIVSLTFDPYIAANIGVLSFLSEKIKYFASNILRNLDVFKKVSCELLDWNKVSFEISDLKKYIGVVQNYSVSGVTILETA